MGDVRVRLDHGTIITIGGNDYCVTGFLSSDGASCLVYTAKRIPTEFEKHIGMPHIPAIIKEFYPKVLAEKEAISRHLLDLVPAPANKYEFDKFMQQFLQGAVKQVQFYGEGSIHSLAPSRVGYANNTVYTAVDSAIGTPLSIVEKQLTVEGVAQVIASLCEAVKELHDRELLHLDIKPSNIFLFSNNGILSNRVALFDFDTVMSIEEAQSGDANISFSPGWSAPEQGTNTNRPQYKNISTATDVFTIGAVLYWAITGNKVTDDLLTKIKLREHDFLNGIHDIPSREGIRCFLEKTLQRDPRKRARITGG
ncbi:MAG: protein kinase [Firmicutes bacterium]|nr:protein kinase [Bacillota bacterium]